MRIISYNVNGIRAAINKGFAEWLRNESPDIICIQEIKAMQDQVDISLFTSLGYNVYLNPAEKKGYSGVAVFTKRKPDNIVYGLSIPEYDREGRVIRVDFGDISQVCVYIPSGTSGDERQDFKMKFLKDFTAFITDLRKQRPNLIISGDYNICHKPIDINHPERHENMSGFLPEERAWFDEFIGAGLVDSFREFNKAPNIYSWWSYRANSREKNLGWRIDYNIVTEPLKSKLRKASILGNVFHSDHCPVTVELDV